MKLRDSNNKMIDKDRKAVIMAALYMFKKLEKKMSLLNWDMEFMKKRPTLTSRDDNYVVLNQNCVGVVLLRE